MFKAKILVIHLSSKDVDAVIEKVKKFNKKAGPFEYVFLLGEFELRGADLSGLPHIIATGSATDGAEIESKDLTVLNQFGILDLPKKLRIGYINLKGEKLEESQDAILNTFNKSDRPVDILVSTAWSVAIAQNRTNVFSHQIVDDVCKIVKPSYHFTVGDSNKFFELEPFTWQDTKHITRFINIASFRSKSKWAYAFNLNLGNKTSEVEGESKSNLITNPYEAGSCIKRSLEPDTQTEDKYSGTKKAKTVLPSDCHFCFTNPNVEDHLFVSISNHAYLTTAKGPLSVPRGDMEFSGHCLIIPIEHIPKLNMGGSNFQESPSVRELMSYELSVVKMNYRKFDMSSIVFEIHSERSVHFHKQLIPVPKYLTMKFSDALHRQVYLNNEKYKSNAKLEFKTFESAADSEYLSIVNDPTKNYLQFTVYETSDSVPVLYLSLFSPEARVDLQFGRRVVAFLLRLPKRVNWTSAVCQQTKKQEEVEVKKFQEGYSGFDIANLP